MRTTRTRNGITVTATTLPDGRVDLTKPMTIEMDGKTTEAYPDKGEGKNYGTMKDQLDYAETIRRFDQAYTDRKRKEEDQP